MKRVKAKNNVILRCVKVAAPSPQEISTYSAQRRQCASIELCVCLYGRVHHLHATNRISVLFEIRFAGRKVRAVLQH